MLSRDYTLEPGMRGLRIALRLTFVIVVVMAIVGFSVVKDSLTIMNDSINDVSAGAESRDLLNGIRKASTNLMLMGQGLMSADRAEVERRNIYYLIQNLTAVQSQLYLHRRTMNGELNSLYTSANIELEEIVSSKVSVRLENLWYSISTILANADQIRQLSLTSLAETRRPEYFVRILCFNAV